MNRRDGKTGCPGIDANLYMSLSFELAPEMRWSMTETIKAARSNTLHHRPDIRSQRPPQPSLTVKTLALQEASI